MHVQAGLRSANKHTEEKYVTRPEVSLLLPTMSMLLPLANTSIYYTL